MNLIYVWNEDYLNKEKYRQTGFCLSTKYDVKYDIENKKVTINSKKPLELPSDLAKDIFQKEASKKKEAKKKADTTNIWTYYDQVYWGM